MPGADGRLSQEENDKVVRYMAEKFPVGLHCPCCHSNDWNLEQHTMTAVPMGPDQLKVFGHLTVYPQIALLCSVCGHNVFFSAISIGLYEGIVESPPSRMGGTVAKRKD